MCARADLVVLRDVLLVERLQLRLRDVDVLGELVAERLRRARRRAMNGRRSCGGDAALRRLLLERLRAAGLRGERASCASTSPSVTVTPSRSAASASTSWLISRREHLPLEAGRSAPSCCSRLRVLEARARRPAGARRS